MIGSSRRRSGIGAAHAGFELHLREARAAALHRRLLSASLVAVAAALVTLFLPLPLTTRALVAALGALVGALLPLRGGVGAALASIREQTGLSYETALGVLARRGSEAAEAPDDPYGFEREVIERAALSVRGYESERRPPWWLPALVVAAALVALPELVSAAPSSQGVSPTASAPQEGAQEAPAPEPGPEPAPPQPPAPGRAEAPAAPTEQEEGEEGEPIADLPEGDMEGQAPLSRFLESLRSRPATADGPEAEAGDAEEPPQSEGRTDEEPAGQTTSGDQQGTEETGQEQEVGEGDTGEGSSSLSEGAEDGSEPAELTAEEGGSGADPESPDASGEEQGAEAGGEQPGAGEQGPDAGEGEGDTTTTGGSGEPSEGTDGSGSAGVGGAPTTDETTGLDTEPGNLEMLSGVLQDGPESVGGSVRLPGSSEVELPAGTSQAPYRNAAEEALSEGELPLDYQEIIRRYFR